MPLNKWIDCNAGNLNNCRKGRRGSAKKDEKNWIRLHDEYLKKFGLNETYKELLELQIDKALAEMEFVITSDRKGLNKIRQLEAKLQRKVNSKGENVDIDEVLVYLSKYYGYRVDKAIIKVSEYFSMLNIYVKAHGRTD